jgi:aminopeptidase N
MMYEREAFGQDYFDKARRNAQNAAFNASSKDLFPIASSKAGSSRWYPKGAVVLEMLKYVVGREEFNRAIKHYLESHPYSNVDSEDLLVAFHETLGYSLDWFWDQWIYRAGEPIYQIKTTSNETQTTFDVTQLQENLPYVGLFKMPIVFELHFSDGTSVNKTVWVSEKQSQINLEHPAGKKLAYPLFDPGNQVIKGCLFEKSFEFLKAQALTAKHMLDRLDAIEALQETAIDKKRDLLHQVYKQETFYAVKEAIIDQLAKDDHKKSKAILIAATKDADVQVRKAVISSFDTIPSFMKKPVEMMLSERSYQLQEDVLNKLCLSFPKEINSYLDLTKAEQGNNAHNVRLTWLKWKIQQGDASFKNELIDFASVSFDFNTRRTALFLAKDIKLIDESIISNALNAARSANNRLSNAGVSYLTWAYGISENYTVMIDDLLNKNASEKWEQELNAKIQKVKTK